uniref:Profilin n=1 Tax=Sexangularia sp. CB-2014 TaxID=1486929 RepID=A0A7S1V3C0_9EUKA|mmetsp:Transcript_10871/g.34539  ORF Transcript_10871/g.34539 Transcript_10871/m.34539 type:complete len:129 (+) Transcript_10871:459-845(+)|eukprot:CAMPEP_0170734494 /NCGR_PEP_ID=MMETSP0437-20130122/2620_1 /TAXON_ID=0 /ORGANISM="Sexangularia sp." /LENGTH=128 /DNA_ID=CAMNT_0011072811 /DNA_START=154 /DNA_END=540 /DNA_ORIENTATION=-
MSWQQYVDSSLLGTGTVSQAAIIDAATGAGVWAKSAAFNLTPQEGSAIVNLFKTPGSAFATGVHIGGTKYLCIRHDDRSIYGKKGATGVVIVKCKQCVVIAYYGDSIQPGQCTNTVEKLADYLIEAGY